MAQTYHVKSIVLGNVRRLRTTKTMNIYLVSLMPPSAPKSPIICDFHEQKTMTLPFKLAINGQPMIELMTTGAT